MLLSSVAHNSLLPDYRVLPTYQAVAYLHSYGMTVKNHDATYGITSRTGRVYLLPNGEVVLIGSRLIDDYPAFVFTSVAAFTSYRDQDFFPVPRRNMSWAEAHAP